MPRPFSLLKRLISFVVLAAAIGFTSQAFAESSHSQDPAPSPAAAESAPEATPAPTPDPGTANIDAVKAAITDSDKAMVVALERQLTASRVASTLQGRCRLTTIGEESVLELEKLTAEIIAATQPSLPTSVTSAEAALKEAETKLKAAKDALPTATPLHADVIKAKKDAEAKLEEVSKRLKALGEEKTKLATAINKGMSCVQGLAGSMSEKIAPLKNLAADAAGDTVLQVLAQSLPDLTQVITYKERVSELWGAKQSTGGLMRALSSLGKTDAELKTVSDALDTVDKDVKIIGEQLKTRLATAANYVKDKRSKLGLVMQQIVVDPATFSSSGQSEVKAATRMTSDLRQLTEVLGLLQTQFSGVVSATDLQSVSDQSVELEEEIRRTGVAITLLQDALGGSFENFQADQISLYYFTDVRRLMQALNPATFEMGGHADARELAAQSRRDLTAAELTLAESQGRVNTHQRRLEELKEEQRQAKAQFLSANSLFTTATRKLDELKSRPDKDERRITAAEQRTADLQAERDAAKERDDELSNEQTGLPAKIAEAKSDLLKAQEKVRETRASIVRLALAESESFASARDNAPFLVATPVANSTDPAKRVLMYAFADSKTLFLRGRPVDLDEVKNIIAGFDRPSPQARMTLWTLELNSTADKDGSRKFNDALQAIEAELANTRARIATSLSFLRDSINQEVNLVAREKLGELREFRRKQKLTGVTPQDSADLRWARLFFYQNEVRMRLGFFPNATPEPRSDIYVAHFTLPDPAATSTLGESLLILTLARPESQLRIINNFKEKLKQRIDALSLTSTLNAQQLKDNPDPYKMDVPDTRFSFLRRAMGLDLPAKGEDDTNAVQQEIIRAIQAVGTGRITARFATLLDDLREIQDELENADPFARNASILVRKAELKRERLIKEMLPLIAWLRNEMGLRVEIPASATAPNEGLNDIRQLESLALQGQASQDQKQNAVQRTRIIGLRKISETIPAVEVALKIARKVNPLRTANARVAAADQLLKEMIIAVEDDLDRHFVQPMMLQLREGLVKHYKGIGVGIVQRTSVLATNRALARVDARGSAQLALGEETDILEGVQQLANLYLAGQTGNVLSILGGLNALPRRNEAELYGLTTGGVFKVTPIFDPSGQALRFQFDHVAATMIREPDGTVNPQLPRVERHTVNTEVQLSNMELREISRFNANARLGLPKRTWGGIPIANSIPWVRRNLPLIGWFVKKSGDAPFVQQSLIFGQTTMYPTIGDLMDLLRNTDAPEEGQFAADR